MGLRKWSHNFPQQLIQDGGRRSYWMLVSPYWMKIFAQNLVERCNTTTQARCTWPKLEPEVNSHDVISRTSGPNVGRSHRYTRHLKQIWHTAQETDNHHGRTLKIHLSWKSKMAPLNFEKCQSLRPDYRHRLQDDFQLTCLVQNINVDYKF